jgi:hypothetical protein
MPFDPVKASYQTRHYNAGLPQGGESVFAALATPPESAVAAEARALEIAQENGGEGPNPNVPALKARYAHRDYFRDFYDSASIKDS